MQKMIDRYSFHKPCLATNSSLLKCICKWALARSFSRENFCPVNLGREEKGFGTIFCTINCKIDHLQDCTQRSQVDFVQIKLFFSFARGRLRHTTTFEAWTASYQVNPDLASLLIRISPCWGPSLLLEEFDMWGHSWGTKEFLFKALKNILYLLKTSLIYFKNPLFT